MHLWNSWCPSGCRQKHAPTLGVTVKILPSCHCFSRVLISILEILLQGHCLGWILSLFLTRAIFAFLYRFSNLSLPFELKFHLIASPGVFCLCWTDKWWPQIATYPDYVSKPLTANAKHCRQIWIGLRTARHSFHPVMHYFMAAHYLDLFLPNAYGERDHKASPLINKPPVLKNKQKLNRGGVIFFFKG